MRVMVAYWLIALAVFVLDQWTKVWAVHHLAHHGVRLDGVLNLVLVYNHGAAFGFLSNESGWQNGLFIAVAVIIVTAIIVFMVRAPRQGPLMKTALMMILGGAAGNLADRIRFGEVIDFIDFHVGSWHWYTFNLADSAITVGAVLLAVDAWVSRRVAVPERR